MACSIIRNKNTNEIERVLAENGKDSILFQDILKNITELKEKALRVWAQAYTPSFKSKISILGDSILDQNGEPHLENSLPFFNLENLDESPRQGLSFQEPKTNETPIKAKDRILKSSNTTNYIKPQLYTFAKNLVDRYNNEVGKKVLKLNIASSGSYFITIDNNIANQVNQLIEAQGERIELLSAFSKQLSDRFNIKSHLIDVEQAMRITGGVYKDQPAFYLNGDAYLVKGKATKLSAIHEIFGHPFLNIIEKQNPVLFNNLIKRALSNEEVLSDIEQRYSYLIDENGNLNIDGQKEAVIRALELDIQNKLDSKDENTKTLKSLIKRFFENVRDILNKMFPDNIEKLNENTTIQDLTKILLSSKHMDLRDINPGLVFQETQEQKESIIDKIKKLNEKIIQKLNPVTNEEEYKNTETDKTYDRLTEFLDKNFRYDSGERTSEIFAKRKALKFFRTEGIEDPENGSIVLNKGKINEKTYTFDEYVKLLMIGFENQRTFGKIGHLFMEWILSGDKSNKYLDQIKELATEKQGVRDATSLKEFDFIVDNAAAIIKLLGIKDTDKVITEQIIHNDQLNIATRADGLVEHPDGSLSIIDFKFGNIFSDESTSFMLKYAPESAQTRMSSSRLSQAKLEVAMRAMLIKSQNPEAKFRELAVSSIDKRRLVTSEDVNLQDYLDTLANYYSEKDNDLYLELLGKGLFDSTTYWDKSSELMQLLEESTNQKEVEDLKHRGPLLKRLLDEALIIEGQLRNLEMVPKEKQAKKEIENKLNTKREKIMKQIIEINSKPGERFAKTEDIGAVKAWFGSMNDVSHPAVQAYFSMLREAKMRQRLKTEENRSEFQRILKDVWDEYKQKNPGLGTFPGVNSIGNLGLQYKDFYKFAYILKSTKEGTAYYLIDEKLDKDAFDNLTQAQQNLIRFITKNMQENYKTAMSRYIVKDDVKGYKLTKAQALNKPKELPAGFFPKIPLQLDEFREQYNLSTKGLMGLWTKYKESVVQDFYDADYNALNQAIGIPLKYMGSSETIEKGDYSLDLEKSYLQFMQNLYAIQELDDIYAVGKGLETYLKEETRSGSSDPIYKNLSSFFENQLKLHVLDVRERGKYSQKGLSWTDQKSGRRYRLDLDTVLNTVRLFTTYGSMWFKPLNAAFNGGLILAYNHKRAFVGDLVGHIAGVPPEQLDFDTKDLVWGEAEFLNMQKDLLTGKEKDNKLWLLLQRTNFLPDNYDYAIRENEKIVQKNPLLNTSTPLFMNRFVEDMGTVSLFAAMLHHMKNVKTGKSIYDSYQLVEKTDPNTKKKYKDLEWIGGTRGVQKQTGFSEENFKEIKELTTEEITRLKRVSQRIHGSYRQDERSNAELYAIGKLFLQFKKYLPQQLFNLLQGSYKDVTLGEYIEKGKIKIKDPVTGVEREENVYEWIARTNQGSMTLLLRSLLMGMSTFGDYTGLKHITEALGIPMFEIKEEYKWKNLSAEQKKTLALTYVNIAIFAITLIAYFKMFPDDKDRKTMAATKYMRIVEDQLEGASPVDILRSMNTPIVSMTRAYNVSRASAMFAGDLIFDERQKDGKLHGETMLKKSAPLFSSVYDIQRFMDESYKGNLRER